MSKPRSPGKKVPKRLGDEKFDKEIGLVVNGMESDAKAGQSERPRHTGRHRTRFE